MLSTACRRIEGFLGRNTTTKVSNTLRIIRIISIIVFLFKWRKSRFIKFLRISKSTFRVRASSGGEDVERRAFNIADHLVTASCTFGYHRVVVKADRDHSSRSSCFHFTCHFRWGYLFTAQGQFFILFSLSLFSDLIRCVPHVCEYRSVIVSRFSYVILVTTLEYCRNFEYSRENLSSYRKIWGHFDSSSKIIFISYLFDWEGFYRSAIDGLSFSFLLSNFRNVNEWSSFLSNISCSQVCLPLFCVYFKFFELFPQEIYQ